MANKESAELKLKKAHVRLMKNRLTAPYIGAIMLGESIIENKETINCNGQERPMTACTNGVDKIYGKAWIESQSLVKMCGGVLHENLHVFLKHIPRHMDLMKEDAALCNAAMDYVVNDLIVQIKDQDAQLVDLPDNGLWNIKFRNWSVREVYNYLKRGQNNQGKKEGKAIIKIGADGNIESVSIGGEEYKIGGQDEHDGSMLQNATPQQVAEVIAKISDAIHQGGLLAGRMGMEIPRAIKDSMEPEVDWADETRDFVSTATRGNDEFTFRKFNKRRVADDYFLPSTESETVGEVIVGIDTSGSIGQTQLDEFAAELVSICELCQPDLLRVLWWDTSVHGMQTFDSDSYQNIRHLLKPIGGGGTHVGCVSDYILGQKLNADCVVIFTDGYVESNVKWKITCPTLWLVTQNESFNPPIGKVVKYRGRS